LDAAISLTQDYSVLAELNRDLHGLLAGDGQISTEYNKTKYLADALKHDPAGLYAIEIFYCCFSAIPDRTFEKLLEILIVHAPTFIPTNSTLGYSNAMSTTTSSALAAPIDAASAPDMRRSSPGIKKSWRHLTKKWRHITHPLFPKDSRA
jgi:hypothetical protein